jgi:hypothetical protein
MKKLERDGTVAILYSPGHGAGWSTWDYSGKHRDYLLFDPELVQAVLDKDFDKAAVLAETHCPDFYPGGARDLRVQWLPKGTTFKFNEYDGSESLSIMGDIDYVTA